MEETNLESAQVQNLQNQSQPAPVKKKLFGKLTVIVIVVLVLLYIISALTPLNFFGLNKNSQNNWKAVFLTNGQVYFGKVKSEKTDPVVMSEIYYLQVTQPLQQVAQGETPVVANQPQLSLVKLGNELHGPEDEMRVNREHIIFIEDLKDDGRVVEALNAYVVNQ